jgi:tetratricopeptide (TPR) repeat protein
MRATDAVSLARPRDYLSAYLDVAWQADLDAGLRTWVEAFQEALDTWDQDECRRLLREIKASPLDPEAEDLVRYVEGRWAEQRGDLFWAVECYQASLAINRMAGHRLREAQVLGDLGLCYRSLGQLAEASECLQAGLNIYRKAGEEDSILQTLSHLAAVYTERGRWEDARIYLDEGLEFAERPPELALLVAGEGAWHHVQGQLDAASRCYEQALGTYRTIDESANVASLLNNLGVLGLEQHRLEEARACLVEALDIYQTLGDWAGTARTLGNLTLLSEAEGNLPAAVAYCTEAIESVRTLQDARARAVFLNLRGSIHADMGNWKAAAADQKRSLKLSKQVGDQPTQVAALNNLGTACRHLDRLAKAHEYYQKALVLAESLGDRKRVGEIVCDLGHLYAEQGNNAEARAHYEQAVTIAKDIGDPVLESASVLGLCGLAFEEGDIDRLAILLERARLLGEASSQPDVLARTSWLQGDLALLAGDHDVGLAEYANAALHAAQAGDSLLAATLERLTIHLEYLEPDQRREAGRTLRRAWGKILILASHPEVSRWLDEVTA